MRHCLSLGYAEERVPARVRLDEAIGPELSRRLVESLKRHGVDEAVIAEAVAETVPEARGAT